MRLAAFDPGGSCGFAHGDPFQSNRAPPFSGALRLPKDATLTQKLVALEAWAIDLIKGNGITDVFIERPIMPSGHLNFDAIATVAGYAFILGVAATKCGCHCVLIDIATWRSELGLPTQGPKNVLADPYYADKFKGRKGGGLKEAKRQYVKDRAFDYARKMGSDPKDDNESDAICIWHCVANSKRAKAEAPKYDLFGGLEI